MVRRKNFWSARNSPFSRRNNNEKGKGGDREHGGQSQEAGNNESNNNNEEKDTNGSESVSSGPSSSAPSSDDEHSDDESSSNSSDSSDDNLRNHTCENCHRTKASVVSALEFSMHPYYNMDISLVSIFPGKVKRKKFSTLTKVALDLRVKDVNGMVQTLLCTQCEKYLCNTVKHLQKSKEMDKCCWPGMIWLFLSSEEAFLKHGLKVWSVIPLTWRPWWLSEFRRLGGQRNSATITFPASVIKDVTIERATLKSAIEELRFKQLKKAVNDHLHLVVKCPWGCNDYYHKCKNIRLEHVVAASIGFEGWESSQGNDFQTKVQSLSRSIRPHFLWKNLFQKEYLLLNEAWQVFPSIAFIDSYPQFLLCRHHGVKTYSRGYYVHPPEHPLASVPSVHPDQLAPVSCRPRTIRPIKARHYSTSFQMQEMRGQFNGVDTIQLTNAHVMEELSISARCHESVVLHGRQDVKNLVQEWALGHEPLVPPSVAQSILSTADESNVKDLDLDDYLRASTVITVGDAITLYRSLKHGKSRSLIVVSTDEDVEDKEVEFSCNWPTTLIFIHPYNEYGMRFSIIEKPSTNDADCRLLWFLLQLVCGTPVLWHLCSESVKRSDQWEGFLLSYGARLCNIYVKQRGNNYFRIPASLKKRIRRYLF